MKSNNTQTDRLLVSGVAVIDGDTVRATFEGDDTIHKIRLHGIDAPELDQEYGPESRDRLITLIAGKTVYADLLTIDCYGRLVGVLHDGNPRLSINKEMVECGMAYNWPKYGMLWGGNNAQVRARSKRVGIWQRFGGEVRPWSHRHGGTLTPIEFTKAKLEEAELEKARRNLIQARVEAELANALRYPVGG